MHTLTLNDLTKRVYIGTLKWPPWTSLHEFPQMTSLNEFTKAPLNNPPKWVNMDALKRLARMTLHGHPKMTLPNESTRTPPNDLLEQVYMGTLIWLTRMSLHGCPHMTEMKAQGRVGQTSYTNMHKAHPGSQLSIFDTGSCARAWPHTERPHRTSWHGCPCPTFLTYPNKFTWMPLPDPPEQIYIDTLTGPA